MCSALTLCGPPASGKSSALVLVVDALNQMARQTSVAEGASGGAQDSKAKESSAQAAAASGRPAREQLTAFHLQRFSPHALLDPALLVAYRSGDGSWVDGVLVSAIRKALKVRTRTLFSVICVAVYLRVLNDDGNCTVRVNVRVQYTARTWICLDGPTLQSEWIDALVTALSSRSRSLQLRTGENLQLADTISIVFETDSIADVSPATIGKCVRVLFFSFLFLSLL